ncbi:MAG: hypothetical protein ABSF45_27050 [Terriglobia bacterium]|jgi:hypothetical protein
MDLLSGRIEVNFQRRTWHRFDPKLARAVFGYQVGSAEVDELGSLTIRFNEQYQGFIIHKLHRQFSEIVRSPQFALHKLCPALG